MQEPTAGIKSSLERFIWNFLAVRLSQPGSEACALISISTYHSRPATVLVQSRAVLCCAVLCCAVLCCAVPCRAVPCRAVLCCGVPCHVVLCCPVLCAVAGMNLFWGPLLRGEQPFNPTFECIVQMVEQHVTSTRSPAKRVLSVLSMCKVTIQDIASMPLSRMYLHTQHT